jgi:hypothetical protein
MTIVLWSLAGGLAYLAAGVLTAALILRFEPDRDERDWLRQRDGVLLLIILLWWGVLVVWVCSFADHLYQRHLTHRLGKVSALAADAVRQVAGVPLSKEERDERGG